jgi:hypothetical protein
VKQEKRVWVVLRCRRWDRVLRERVRWVWVVVRRREKLVIVLKVFLKYILFKVVFNFYNLFEVFSKYLLYSSDPSLNL